MYMCLLMLVVLRYQCRLGNGLCLYVWFEIPYALLPL